MEDLREFAVKCLLFQGDFLDKCWGFWFYFGILTLLINILA